MDPVKLVLSESTIAALTQFGRVFGGKTFIAIKDGLMNLYTVDRADYWGAKMSVPIAPNSLNVSDEVPLQSFNCGVLDVISENLGQITLILEDNFIRVRNGFLTRDVPLAKLIPPKMVIENFECYTAPLLVGISSDCFVKSLRAMLLANRYAYFCGGFVNTSAKTPEFKFSITTKDLVPDVIKATFDETMCKVDGHRFYDFKALFDLENLIDRMKLLGEENTVVKISFGNKTSPLHLSWMSKFNISYDYWLAPAYALDDTVTDF